jgi:hypothetical protein
MDHFHRPGGRGRVVVEATYNLIHRELLRRVVQYIEQLRLAEAERLKALQASLWDAAMAMTSPRSGGSCAGSG